MVDIAWEGIPNWVVAVSSFLTLGAAIFAGVFAGRAAHWTKAQAEASQRQVDLAHEALTVAQQDSEVATGNDRYSSGLYSCGVSAVADCSWAPAA
jgi:hypothetical protein